MKTNKMIFTEDNKKEIIYNIINSFLAGALVFLGSLTNGGFSFESLGLAVTASLVVMITKFKNYWEKEEPEYSKKLLNFL